MRRTGPRIVAAVLLAAATIASVGVRATTAAPPAWCGTPTAVDQPDSASAFQIHVLYVIPSDAPDRFAERLSPILSDLAAIDAWWRAQDPSRTPRFDLLPVVCDSIIGRVDLTDLRLPGDAIRYGDGDNGFQRLTGDLAREPLAFHSPEKKYLVYYDGPRDGHRVCGVSPDGPARSSGVSVVYLDSLCGADLGGAGEAAATAAHELLHNLGARPGLHGCSGTRAHTCDATSDILYYAVESGALLSSLRLDVGRDDYYGLSRAGGAPDVRDSPFLERVGGTGAAPIEPPGLSATSTGGRVTISWPAATGGTGPVLYRVARGETLFAEVGVLTATDVAPVGETLTYTLRAADADGYLSAPQTITFKAGAGIVDGTGTIVQDTVSPPKVTGLRATAAPRTVIVRWRAVTDAGGLAGYRILRDGRPFARLVRYPSLTLRASQAHATWTVAAVDLAGNTGAASEPLRLTQVPVHRFHR
jgi:hypothetical protein